MKKLFTFFNFLLLMLFISTVMIYPQRQLKRLWEKSDRLKNKAAWFGTGNTSRGFAYGVVGGNERLYVVNGSAIQIVNATDGSDVGTLDVTGVTGGTLALCDVEVDGKGVIYACNLTTNASTSAFKVYKWSPELSAPVNIISYTGAAYRLGDKFTVVGDTVSNSIVIYAAASGSARVMKFTTADNGVNYTATEITLSDAVSPGTNPSVTPVGTGAATFYLNGNSINPKEYNSTGTLNATMPNAVVPTPSNAIRYFVVGGQTYLATIQINTSTNFGGNFTRIANISSGIGSATFYGTTPDLGYTTNSNGSGDVAVKDNGDGTFNVYVLSTNNGFGAYTNATPTDYSGTYTVGSSGTYSSLLAACDALNQGNITGDVTLSITSNLTEDRNICLGVNTNGKKITIKPAALTSPTIAFTQAGDVPGPSGAFVIGSSNLADYVYKSTDNVIIDGSNTESGTTKDLSMTVANNSTTYGFRIIGNTTNTTFKNLNLTLTEPDGSASYSIYFNPRNANSTDYIPNNGIVENCSITNTGGAACQGIVISFNGTLTTGVASSGMIFRNNTVTARTRGIFINAAANYQIYGNTVAINQTTSGLFSYGIWALSTNSAATNNSSIYNNKLTQLSTANTTAGPYGIAGIAIDVPGNYEIYNNAIYGFSYPSTVNGTLAGIYITNASANCNVYYNSIYIGETGLTSGALYGIAVTSATYAGTVNIKDNIVSLNDADATAYCTYRGTIATGTYTSDYNDFYPNGTNVKFGYWGASGAQADLATWQSTTSQDANSLSANPEFFAPNDLHITGDSPVISEGIDVGISTDLEGNARPNGAGYDMGAYEFQTPANAPEIPVATAANNIWYTSFFANWNASTYSTSYRLDVATDAGFTTFVPGYQNLAVGNVTTFKVSGLNDNTPYYYRVRGFNGLTSGNSNTITVTTTQKTSYSGIYYIGITPPRPTETTFATLKDACDALNDGKIVGDVTMYITSNLTEASNVALAVNTGGYTITFKPYTSTTPTINFTQTTDNAGVSGQWVIGARSIASWDSLVATSNIVIDGSNTVGGTTRDLTITNVENDVVYNFGIRVAGNADNVTVKNTNITITETGNTTSSSYAINFAARGSLVPDNGIVDNCNIVITQPPLGQGIAITPSTTPASGITSTGMIFRNNTIEAAIRGIFVNIGSSFSVYNNTIMVTQTGGGFISHGIFVVSTNSVTNHTCNIYNNNIKKLTTANTLTGNGLSGITIDNPGTYNIYNNMIYGFDFTAAATLGFMHGIRSNSASSDLTLNISYNTILLPEDAELTASDIGGIAGIALTNSSFAGNATIKNNIIIVNNNPICYGIYRANAGGTFVSDYNDIYTPGTNGNTGAWNGTAQQTLALWQAASSQDANSKSVAVTFNLPTDLHLVAPSIGDGNLRGTPIAGITTDIDNQTRNAVAPYMGADERPESPLVRTLNLTALVQEFYNGTNWYPDVVTAQLLETTSPWLTVIDQAQVNLDANGVGTGNFFVATDATNYYLVLKHRNSLETWSKNPVQFSSGALTYDFTTAATQAYGDNLVLKGGEYCMWSGDITQDGSIDALDRSSAWNDRNLSGYQASDVNGDGIVDALDRSICWNNRNLSRRWPGEPPLAKPIKINEIDENQLRSNE